MKVFRVERTHHVASGIVFCLVVIHRQHIVLTVVSDELPAITRIRVPNCPEVIRDRISQRGRHILIAGKHIIQSEINHIVDLHMHFQIRIIRPVWILALNQEVFIQRIET